jgi:hypothetical protein
VRHEVVDVAVTPLEDGRYLLFCQQDPTEACVAGNGGVRSPRHNVASSQRKAARARADAATASLRVVGNQDAEAGSTRVKGRETPLVMTGQRGGQARAKRHGDKLRPSELAVRRRRSPGEEARPNLPVAQRRNVVSPSSSLRVSPP